MTLLQPRSTYSPFEYPQAYDYWLKAQSAHWLPTEIQMSSDINDWKINLSEKEKNVVGNILKGFVATEIFIEDYWGSKICKWFKKPEIQMMANTFASFESIHAVAYSLLEETLGIQNHESFLHEPTAKAKIDRLMECKGKTKEEIALSLAIFSAFNEGVNLFSSFAVLLSFSRRNLLKGVGKIIEWSIRDESLHAVAGCYLFRTFISEYPEILTDELKQQIYEAARVTVQLEDNFIDRAFEQGSIEGLDPKDLKNYIRFRTNAKLQDLGLKSNWKNVDKESLERLSWFDVLSAGVAVQDFFAGKDTNYSKSVLDFTSVWGNNESK
jgi:ribonucleoside-diphosphate reductase beta chain